MSAYYKSLVNPKMFVFGKQYGLAVCETYQNDFHKNIAYLVVLGKSEDITVIDRSGTSHTAPALLIKPMVEHRVVRSSSPAWHIFLAPHSEFAANLDDIAGDVGVFKLPAKALPFHSAMSKREIVDILDSIMTKLNVKIDPRLAAALEDLGKAPLHTTLMQIAKRYDLSTSRLRVLAKQQIGVSLSTLLLWRKLVKSMEALSRGVPLSEAAQAGGFADQSHFTRTVRKMLGTTPSSSTRVFNYQK